MISMAEVIEIPQIGPKEEQETGKSEDSQEDSGKQEDSILVPRIDPGKHRKSKASFKGPKEIKNKKLIKIAGLVTLVLFVFLLIVGLLFFRIYKKALIVQTSVQSLIAAGEEQNIEKIKAELSKTEDSLSGLEKTYNAVSWMKFIPYFGGFVSDGQHGLNAAGFGIEAAEVLISAIEPYADIIGFAGDTEEPEGGQETAQDRLDFVIKSIPDVIPKADELSQKVEGLRSEIEQINPERYPITFAGKQIRTKIQKGIELVDLASQLVTDGKPLLEVTPYLLGVDEPRTYLVLFQNDKELRPTGGFLTAYSIARVENGKFEPVSSNDIYNLDARYMPSIKAPEQMISYLKGPYIASPKLRLRDINWNPDYYESMKVFVAEIEKVGIKDIDGVIAVDTQVLVYLLDVLGPIGVSGFGNYSTEIVPECNCPQVIYELESFADIEGPVVWSENEPGKIVFAPPHMDNRKKIIGPLMNSILANAMGQPKDKLPALFEAAYKSLVEKHVLFYLLDDQAQAAVESFGIAGRVNDYDSDYLHINDANLGGRKSNLYVTQEVLQEIEIAKDGSVEKTLTLTYKNPEKYDGWLNSVLPNWVRIYVPKGAELIAFEGVEDSKEPYEEFGKTVFAGFFKLRPQGVAKVTVKYKLPFKAAKDEYRLFIQKQPGTDAPLHIINISRQASGPVGPQAQREEELFLKTDKELKLKI